jgi:RHS repeat-associated protein
LVSGTLTNNGVISANGAATAAFAGGGAGGSVYVTAGSLVGSGSFTANGGTGASNGGGGGRVAVYYGANSNFTGFAASTATAGANGSPAATNGSSAFFDTSVTNSNVGIYQNFPIPAQTTVTYNSLTVAAGGVLTIGGGSQITVTSAFTVGGTIVAQSIDNTATLNGVWQGAGVEINAASVQVNAGGAISADGQGYVPNAGPAGAAPGSSNGGSYGGLGGGTGVGPTYGSITTPTDLGSGGGFCCGGGASPGGGAIRLLVTGALTNNGAISANGANAPAAGAGAGGSLYIAAGTLAGSGSFSANGGQGGSGGGGGRVAVYYAGSNGFNAGSITAAGGQGNNSGSPGSVNVSSTQSLLWLRPTESVLHGLETLQWFADFGSSVNLTLAGPQTFTLSAGAPLASTMAFDTTTVPDGRYELLLTALDAGGNTLAQQPLTVVVNNSVVWHSGTIASNQEWTANQVQGIDGVVVIPSGVTLTIDPGTIVKALPGAEIVVQSGGTLNAPGGVSLPVIFTTFDDSSVGGNTDFNAGISVPTPGEWQGVSVQTGGQLNSTNNTQFRYVSFPLSGTLSSQTLQSTSIYTVTGIAVVPSGVTLSIAPGTILKFNAGAGIAVQPGATFTAVGTVSQPIYFTSIKDDSVGGDTNGDGSATMPAPGDWASIVIDGAQATLVHVQMLYGSGPLSASADVVGMIETTDNATVTISDCMIAQGFWNGIQTGYPNGGGDTVTVTNTVLWGLGDRAINAWPGSIVHVVNDTIDGNSTGILSHGGTVDVANSIVSNTKSSQWGGIAACCGGTYTSIAYSDVWTSVAGVPNYSGLPDPTGANGNISANPVFVNEPQGIFQLNYGSPAIDAGNGTVANYPLTDFLGNARYNDPQVTTKTGVPDANGNYPDMGAFEFTATATSNIDLTVPTVTGPTSALVGNTVTINWTVTNIGSGVAYGPWHDAVYLVQDPDTNPVPIFAGQFLEGAGAVLGPGASYNASATIRVPGATIGNQRWEVKTNVLGEVFEGQNTVNNTGIALDPVAIDLTPLVVNGPAVSNSFAATGQSWWYKINPTAGRTLSLNLNLSAGPGAGSVQLFIGQGYVPTPQNFDIQQVQWNSPAASAVISNAANQTYYVTAYAQSLAASPASFGLTASTLAFSLTGVEPSNVINTGDATLTFTGGGFVDGAVFQLVGPSGTVYNPTAVFISDSATAQVTFSMSGLPTGSYTATVMLNGTTVKLNNAVAVALAPGQTGNSTIAVSLSTPAAFRTGFPAEVTLHYTNVSGVDQYAPLIGLTASGATMSLAPPQCTGCNSNFALQYQNTFTAGYVLGISEQGPAGILPAGTSGSVTFLVTPGTGTNVTFGIHSVQPSTLANTGVDAVLAPQGTDALIGSIIYQPIQLARQPKVGLPNDETLQVGTYGSAIAFCNGIMPPNASPLGFTRTCMQLLNESGFQYLGVGGGNYTPVGGALSIFGFNQVLAADATALSQMGIYEPNAANLLNFEFLKDGLAQFNQRYHQGAFGLGPSHPFDITAGLTGTLPTIYYPDGSARVFATPNPSQPNQYLGALGDYGVLTAEADGSWLVTENNGWLYHFIADPLSSVNSHHLLDYIQDLNGNRTSVTYTNDLATTITDSFGNTMTFEYDSQGHITKATDPVGRVTTYTYDVANASLGYAFLTSFTNPAGTTTLTWNEGGSNGVGYFDDTCVTTYCQAAIGINTIAYPDGTHTYFTYDTVGRRASQYNDNNSQQLTYSYGNNGVTVTDALGNTSTTALTAQGQVGQFTDPLANVTQFSYDPEVKLTRVLGPSGTSVAFGYDTSSDLNSWRDPRGNQTSMSFAADGYLQSLTDADGNAIAYSYNASYNPTGLTFPDGSAIQSTYDSRGNMLTYTNRRGHTTTFTYNQSNLLTSKTYANGAQVQYSYDTHRNLQSVTTSAGTTMYTYDSADRLTGVFYPNGQSVQYSYNSGGQRTGMNDSTGFAVNYTYDSVGRPSQLSNGSNRIVSYTYDAAGKLTQKTLGNGTYTTYAYDAAGNILHLVNYASNGSVLSEFDYTYDGLGRRIGMNSPAGAWTFSYDADSQLTLVTMPGGSVQYTYDAAGNRTASVSGSPSSFLVNNLNEYTQAGANSYQYDADGNLISGGGWTYTYDDDNWLVSAASATDTWSYQYDGLGNRISTTHNGTVTQYLNDPSGFGNVEAEFDGNGHLVGHYTYGLDLVSSVPAGGSVAYYHFDAAGNTAQVTNTSGSVVDSYTYLPFGEKLSSTGSLTNPFTFAGEFGVMDEGSGLYFMRQRWYNPPLGRFVQLDPTGLVGGSPNLYTYANNNPTSWIDPNGEAPYSWNWSNGSPALQQAAENRALLEQEGYQSQQAHEQQLAEGRSGIVGIGTSAMSAGLPNYAGHAIDAGTRNLVNVPEPDQGPSHWNGLDNLCGGCLFNDAPQNVVVPQAHSADPNGKLTSGFGTQGYIPPNVSIPYTIYFENQSSATAPAQKVVVTDPLPSNLDWSTLQLNQIEFNNVTINVPPGLQTYTTQVNVSTDPNPVNVSASLNPSSGVLTWTMQSVDPTTGGPPANRLAGFLPPNNASNQGTGLVTFTVSPKSGMGNAAVITNQASIVFDANAPIATNTVTNTIDSTVPTSSVNALPASTSATSFNVSWSGSDPGGSGIAGYNIFVAADGGQYGTWLPGTAQTSATFTAVGGHTYSFYSLAVSNVGTIQVTPGASQTIAVTASSCTIPGLGIANLADVQLIINQALGVTQAVNDLNSDGKVNVVDVEIAIGGVLGTGCTM